MLGTGFSLDKPLQGVDPRQAGDGFRALFVFAGKEGIEGLGMARHEGLGADDRAVGKVARAVSKSIHSAHRQTRCPILSFRNQSCLFVYEAAIMGQAFPSGSWM